AQHDAGDGAAPTAQSAVAGIDAPHALDTQEQRRQPRQDVEQQQDGRRPEDETDDSTAIERPRGIGSGLRHALISTTVEETDELLTPSPPRTECRQTARFLTPVGERAGVRGRGKKQSREPLTPCLPGPSGGPRPRPWRCAGWSPCAAG